MRPHTDVVQDFVIYGDDTRRDVHAVEDPRLAQVALDGVVAFVSAVHLVPSSDATFAIAADTLRDANQLCPGEAFEAQPTAATCSGVLIDDRLVLTAGHCVSDDAVCGDERLVFGYAITSPGGAVTIDASDVYRCASIPVRSPSRDASGRRSDYAIVELDRPAGASRRPVEIAAETPDVGSPVVVVGYPSGLPVKIDAGAQVLYGSPCDDSFTLSSDTFQGSSGSGVFDVRGRLVGSLVRGGVDYEFVSDRGCAVPRRIDMADPMTAEQAEVVGPAIAALCASGWASARLCAVDRIAATPDSRGGSCTPDDEDTIPTGCSATGRSDRGYPACVLAWAIAAVLARRRSAGRSLTSQPSPYVRSNAAFSPLGDMRGPNARARRYASGRTRRS